MKTDSIIFDMDGTLWDAVDSYAEVWNVAMRRAGITAQPVTRQMLLGLMGNTLDVILASIMPDLADRDTFLKELDDVESSLMPVIGGRLYDGVVDTIKLLAGRCRLFLVSNCGANGLTNFLHYTDMSLYFTDTATHGGTRLDKAGNIKALIERYGLKSPVYVGDTQGDADHTHRAGIPFVWAAYGFGHVVNPDYIIHSISELPDILP